MEELRQIVSMRVFNEIKNQNDIRISAFVSEPDMGHDSDLDPNSNPGLQDVIVEGNVVGSAPPGSREAMEHSMRQKKVIDFLKFHDSVPLASAAQGKSLQQGNHLFGAPPGLRASTSLPCVSPPTEEADSPSVSRFPPYFKPPEFLKHRCQR